MSLTLKYRDGAGVVKKRSIKIVAIKGFDDPETYMMWPNAVSSLFDGSLRTDFRGFRRAINVDFGVLEDVDDHAALLEFFLSNTRSVAFNSILGTEEIFCATDTGLESEWIENCKLRKKFKVPIIENVVRTAWTDYTPTEGEEFMYAKLHVRVEGTEDAPETFRTNLGKLLTMETGQPFPPLSLLSWVARIHITGGQSASIFRPGEITNVGTDIEFQLAVANGGNPAPDGSFYCDIDIAVQARPE